MSFSDKLQRYKNKTATEEEIEYIENEIEKTELILDYLDEQIEDDIHFDSSEEIFDHSKVQIQEVKRSLRKHNMVTGGFLVFTVIILFSLLRVVSDYAVTKMYYNPNQHTFDSLAYDLEISMHTYTQLHFPGYETVCNSNENLGYGSYSTTLEQRNMFTDQINYCLGTITRDTFKISNDFWTFIDENEFVYSSKPYALKRIDEYEQNKRYLMELPNYMNVKCNISFRDFVTSDQLAELRNEYKNIHFAWAGVRNNNNSEQIYPSIGFYMDRESVNLLGMNANYDYFELSDYLDNNEDLVTGEMYELHFQSLLNFQLDNLDYLRCLDDTNYYETYYQNILDMVKKNGIECYGVVVIGTPKDILDLCGEVDICAFTIDGVNIKY